MKILIGTNNKDKLDQFAGIFRELDKDIELLSLEDLEIKDDVEEDSNNLLDNAKKKAEYYGKKLKISTLADDLGLFIDALNGEPGIHSKRWFFGTDKDRYTKILEKMKDVPESKRTCRYSAALAFYNPMSEKFWTYEQDLEGIIANTPKEGIGFGYDSIFIVKDCNRYYSEFSDKERAEISHRGLGAKELLKYLKSIS